MKAEVYSITYRIPLTDAQQAKLDRKWPDGDPFISYERIESLLEPLPVEDITIRDNFYILPFTETISMAPLQR